MALMTKEEFIEYAHEALDGEAMEPIYETISQHNAEVAQFGDSWPGALIRIRAMVDSANKLEATLARLEGRAPRDFRFGVRHPA